MNKRASEDNNINEMAYTAARLLIDGMASDFRQAKRKAATECGLTAQDQWPSNIEVHRALAQSLDFLEGDEWRDRLRAMREEALRAMKYFVEFQPHLVGSTFYGTATAYSIIVLHVFTDEFEQISRRLGDAKISFKIIDTTLNTPGDRPTVFPTIALAMHEFDFEIIVLPLRFRFNPPSSPLDGKSYQWADRQQLTRMLENDVIFCGKYLDQPTSEP